MKHSIKNMKEKLTILDDNRNPVSLNGYAFIDEHDKCIIIVYGEGRKDFMSKYLTEDGDILNIKYQCIDLLP